MLLWLQGGRRGAAGAQAPQANDHTTEGHAR